MPPKKKAAVPAKPLSQDQGQRKRTPQSAFDPAAGKDIYEPEKVMGEAHREGRHIAVPGQMDRLGR